MDMVLLLCLGQQFPLFSTSAVTVVHCVWLVFGCQAAVQYGQSFASHERGAGTVFVNGL